MLSVAFQKAFQTSAEIFVLLRKLLSFTLPSILACCYCYDSRIVCFREFMTHDNVNYMHNYLIMLIDSSSQ